MIIKNNFNSRSVNPLNDYQKIGKGINSLDNKLMKEKEGVPLNNIDNHVIQDILNKDKEYEETEDNKDKWDFFR